jgi:hypothetical protein
MGVEGTGRSGRRRGGVGCLGLGCSKGKGLGRT